MQGLQMTWDFNPDSEDDRSMIGDRMKRAAIYARYSCDKQRDESIDDQVAACREYALAHDMEVVDIFADAAMSGRDDDRPQFQAMLSAEGFEVLLVWKLDRFARDRFDASVNRRHLKKRGVQVVSVTEPISDGPEGIIMEGLLDAMNEYYSANLAQNVRRGMMGNARKLRTNGVHVTGLREAEDGTYEPDPETAPVIRELFERYVAGEGLDSLRAWLHARGIRNRNGGKLSTDATRRLLRQEKYVGVYRWAGFVDEAGIEPIVSRDLFEQAQRILESRAHSGHRARYFLGGRIRCGSCGAPMVGRSAHGRSGKAYRYYGCTCACGDHGREKVCKAKPVRAEVADAAVLDAVRHAMLDEDVIAELSKRLSSRMASMERASRFSTAPLIEKQIRALDRESANLVKSLSMAPTQAVADRLAELERERAEFVSQLDAERRRVELPHVEQGEISQYLHDSIADETSLRMFAHTLIRSVWYREDMLFIEFWAQKSPESAGQKLEASEASQIRGEISWLPG